MLVMFYTDQEGWGGWGRTGGGGAIIATKSNRTVEFSALLKGETSKICFTPSFTQTTSGCLGEGRTEELQNLMWSFASLRYVAFFRLTPLHTYRPAFFVSLPDISVFSHPLSSCSSLESGCLTHTPSSLLSRRRSSATSLIGSSLPARESLLQMNPPVKNSKKPLVIYDTQPLT